MRQSLASSVAARGTLPWKSFSLASKRSSRAKASAEAPAKPASTLPPCSRRILWASLFMTTLPSVTWPSPPMATLPWCRTARIVVDRTLVFTTLSFLYTHLFANGSSIIIKEDIPTSQAAGRPFSLEDVPWSRNPNGDGGPQSWWAGWLSPSPFWPKAGGSTIRPNISACRAATKPTGKSTICGFAPRKTCSSRSCRNCLPNRFRCIKKQASTGSTNGSSGASSPRTRLSRRTSTGCTCCSVANLPGMSLWSGRRRTT